MSLSLARQCQHALAARFLRAAAVAAEGMFVSVPLALDDRVADADLDTAPDA